MNSWIHQADEESKALTNARALPWSPRSGKTKAAVRSARRASLELGLHRFLVVGTTLALWDTWTSELREEWPEAKVLNLAGGSVPERIALLGREMPSEGPVVILVNWEALDRLNPALKALKPEIQGVVADEAHMAKRPGTRRAVALHAWHKAPWKRIMTGTMTPRNYADIYSQWKFLNPSRFGTSQEKFRERFCVMHPKFPGKVIAYQNLDELHRLVALDATVVDRRTVLGTPHELDVPVFVPLPPKIRKLYDELKREHTMDEVNYPNRIGRNLVLRQLTSGFQMMDGEVKWLHDAKIEGMLSNAREFYDADEPLPIFHQWTAEGDRIEWALREYKDSIVRVNGDVPVKRRLEIKKAFQEGKVAFAIWQEATDTQGISLAAADACMFYSQSYNFGTVKQAYDRIWKPEGMLRRLWIRCLGTVDDDVWSETKAKRDASERFEQGIQNAK